LTWTPYLLPRFAPFVSILTRDVLVLPEALIPLSLVRVRAVSRFVGFSGGLNLSRQNGRIDDHALQYRHLVKQGARKPSEMRFLVQRAVWRFSRKRALCPTVERLAEPRLTRRSRHPDASQSAFTPRGQLGPPEGIAALSWTSRDGNCGGPARIFTTHHPHRRTTHQEPLAQFLR
jgi:hypothetical protein